MNQQNQGPSSSSQTELPMKRKRGRPRKDESLSQQEKTPITPKPNSIWNNNAAISGDMVGQVVSGVIEGSFDAGYFLNVKVGNTGKELRGVVFLPGRVAPVTAVNDVAPHAKMYKREEVLVPCLNQQAQPHGSVLEIKDNQQSDSNNQLSKFSDQTNVSELHSGILMTDKNQPASGKLSTPNNQSTKDMGIGSELHSGISVTDENQTADKNESASGMMFFPNKNESVSGLMSLTNDMQIKVVGALSAEKIPAKQISDSGPESLAASLLPQSKENDLSKQNETFQVFEASKGLKEYVTDTAAPKESQIAAIQIVDFFPGHEMGSNPNPNQERVQNLTKISETEHNNPAILAETLGINLMTGKPSSPMESVPENLQLELGSKTINGDSTSQLNGGSQNNATSNTTEATSQSASMSGFLAKLFEGEAIVNERKPAVTESGFPSMDEPKVDSSSAATSNNVDCIVEDAIPHAQSQNPMVLN